MPFVRAPFGRRSLLLILGSSLLCILLAVVVTQAVVGGESKGGGDGTGSGSGGGKGSAGSAPSAAEPLEGKAGVSARRPLQKEPGLYPRAIRLQHSGDANGRILTSNVTFRGKDGVGVIHESSDNGKTFREVGSVADPAGAGGKGLCCTTLYELPQRIGDMPAGTLLWADSPGQTEKPRKMSIRVFKSTDHGRSWSPLSIAATAGNEGGLWEPEFSIDAQGNLVCHYSDETDPKHSQKLMAVRTSDGRKWNGRHATVESGQEPDRPGMAVVRKVPDGTYVMVYEICTPGGKYACVVHTRTSKDGWEWGKPSDLGARPETADGHYFAHAPTLAWAPESGNPQGKLMLIGQVTRDRDGKPSLGGGRTLWTNSKGGEGAWQSKRAPVTVNSGKEDSCANYSSALLPTADGKNVLEIATDNVGGRCKPFYAQGPA